MKPLSIALQSTPVSAALTVDLLAAKQAATGADVIRFSVGEPDFPTPPAAAQAGMHAIERGHTRYANASGTPALRQTVAEALCRDYGLSYAPAQIVITSGAKYAVYAALYALLNPGDEVILPSPYWPSYLHAARLAGGTPVIVGGVQENAWKLTPDALSRAVTKRSKVLILNNPNNPSGAVYSRAELAALCAVCRTHDLYVIADEIYANFVYDGAVFTPFASLDADAKARTVSIGGMSKAYCMTGWRIGFLAADTAVTSLVSAMLSHTTGCPCTISQEAAAAVLSETDGGRAALCHAFEQRRNALTRALSPLLGAQEKPQGAFYALLDVRPYLHSGEDERAFAMALLTEANVAAVPCTDFGLPGYLRLAYTLPEARICEGAGRILTFIGRRA